MLNTRQILSLQQARYIHDTHEHVVGLCATLKNFTGEKPIALPAILAHLKCKYDNRSVCKGDTVQGFANALHDAAKKRLQDVHC